MNSIELLLTQFHFLRLFWLLAIVPIIGIALLLWFQKHNARQWQQIVAPELLPYLLDGQTTRIKPWPLLALLSAWIIACIALAGPSWEKRPIAVEQNQQALVVMLDLSPSMLSEDIKPSRLVRARLKIADLLRLREDGQTALLVYAGDVHVVTPLTDDTETINNIIPALHPNIMPAQGSNTEAAINRGLKLLKDAQLTQGDLLLITDGIDEDAQHTIRDIMNKNNQYRLSILGVGGATPTPIPSNKGGFVRDSKRNIVTTKLDADDLQQLAKDTRGHYRTLANTGSDLATLMDLPTPENSETQRVDREFDSWYDRGHWLVLILLPIILYCFRRGVLLSLLIIPLFALTPEKSYALEWNDLWQNKNQQAYEQLQQEQAAAAAQTFDDPQWKASAQYRAGDYAEAAKNFAQFNSADGHYNRGNALAKANQLDEAIKAYDEALKLNPELADAKNNRQLVEAARKQQKQQNQDQQQNQKDESKDQQDKDQQDKDQQDKNQQDQQKQNEQQQDQSQQEQNSGEQQSSANSDQEEQQSSADAEQQHQQNQKDEQQEQQDKEQDDKEQQDQAQEQQQEQATPEAEETAEQELQAAQETDEELTDEERQAMEQWLRRVPDDPGGLLRNKFKYEHYKRNQEILNGEWTPPENGAENRW